MRFKNDLWGLTANKMRNNNGYDNVLDLLRRAQAIDDAKKRLAEADREPDILQRFIKRGEALKHLEEANERFKKEIAKNG